MPQETLETPPNMGVNLPVDSVTAHAKALCLSSGWVKSERATTPLPGPVMKQVAEVPPKEIELAIRRRRRFASDPEEHTYEENQ